MPTLVRLVIVLLFLAGMAYGAMFALATLVEPTEKEVTIRIPARDLVPPVDRSPIVRREIDTSRPVPPPTTAAPDADDDAGEPAGDGVVTLSPGIE